MRSLLVLALFLAVATAAHADAWVPADPPRDEPFALTAADGTAVRVNQVDLAPLSIEVRPPAGSFRESTLVGEEVEDADAAVAPGGWAAVAWQDLTSGLRLTVVRPDGTSTERKLDGTQATAPTVGIDAFGNVTAAWLTPAGLQTTRGLVAPQASAVDVAVSPSGRRLLTWGTETAVFARADDEPIQQLGAASLPSRMTAEIADDGAALAAFQDGPTGAVTVVDRPAGGAWSAPHAVSGLYPAVPRSFGDDFNYLSTVLTADGRAVVAWEHSRGPSLGVFGVGGRPGGAWGPPTPLSSPIRDAGAMQAGFGAAGDPHVLWGESEIGERGAKWVVGATPDAVPLDAQLTLPARRLSTRTGALEITASVRCAKPCDVRLSAHRSFTSDTRALPAGRTTRLRLRFTDIQVLYPRDPHVAKVELAVADRAGHVQRTKRTYRVRVIQRSMRSFRVGPSRKFGTGSRAGDRAVGRLVNTMLEGLHTREIRTERELRRKYQAGKRELERAGYDLGFDSATERQILAVLEVPLALKGYFAHRVLGVD
ncbi:hypothetical protein OJ998_09255 [Solirubrobacter taibaiensis]|nr:hypothetical protein [Solirubrobacter taibaiensis]